MAERKIDTALLLQALVAEAISKTKDVDAATAYMQKRVEQDEQLFRALMQPLVHDACYDKIRSSYRRERKEIWTAPNYTKGGNGQRIAAVKTLYDFRLPHNPSLTLGDAKKDDVLAGAAFYSKQGTDMLNKARWLEAVAARVGTGTVRSRITETALRKLQEETSA